MHLTISVSRLLRSGVAALVLSAATSGNPAAAWFWQTPDWPQINADLASDYPDVPVISVPQLHQRLSDPTSPNPLLVDTRSAEEFAISHLPGAVHAEAVDAIEALIGTGEKTRPIVVYCSVGVRSARVAKDLLAAGFEDVSNLQGSIFEWANRGLPMMRDQQPANLVHPFNTRWGALLNRQHWSHQP